MSGSACVSPGLGAAPTATVTTCHGYARADFAVDYDARIVTCPQGKTYASWT
jgi:hypothetical protein